MKNEYIIINKTKLEKRLEVLEIVEAQQVGNLNEHIARGERKALENILSSNSIPLTPLLENAFTKGERYGWDSQKSIGNIEEMKEKIKFQSLEDYINNLKLDI